MDSLDVGKYYFEWVLIDDYEDECQLWHDLSLDIRLWDQFGHKPIYWIFVNRIYRNPISSLLVQLATDKHYTKDLFVASYRYRNAMPCIHCERVYQSIFMDCLDEIPIRMLSSFIQCLSLDNATKGDCCNCIWYNYNSCMFQKTDDNWYASYTDIANLWGRSDSSDGRAPQDIFFEEAMQVEPISDPWHLDNLIEKAKHRHHKIAEICWLFTIVHSDPFEADFYVSGRQIWRGRLIATEGFAMLGSAKIGGILSCSILEFL